MLIPNVFVKWTRLKERIPEDVILRNGSGRVWCVKTRRIGDKLFLDEGWKAFREENCVGKADFMVFKYNGNKEFKVIVLELSTQCEKTVIKSEVEEEENMDEGKVAAEEDEEEHEGKTDDEDGEEEEDDDNNSDNDYNDNDEFTEMEEESEEEHNFQYMKASRSQSNSRACKRETATSSTPKIEDPQIEDYEFDPEMYIQSGNPYFEAKVYKSRRNEMHVPANVLRNSSLTFPEKITLLPCQCSQRQDIQRNELRKYHLSLSQQTPICRRYWEATKVSKWNDGRVCVRGWGNFCRRHKIKEKDVCICEIISGEDQVIRTIRVHVLERMNRLRNCTSSKIGH
uniref:B3 domain-containing protein REM21 n=2 Tax=Cajanus cajan TaxID=3821 RepID=A0A151U1G3_CAJCA|nr:B3 domain-containing protein REM21 [Cajanus cajan]